MADDTKTIIESLRAKRGIAGSPPPTLPAIPEPDQDEALGNSLGLLKALGHDQATIESVLPGTSMAPVSARPDLEHIGAQTEAAAAQAYQVEDGLAPDLSLGGRVTEFLKPYGEKAVGGLASVNRTLDKITTQIGRGAAKKLSGGSTNLTLGMGLLDIFTRTDNFLKIALFAPDEKKAELALRYLPRAPLLDPSIDRDFSTSTEAALWAIGQRVWGSANTLAALPPEMLGKALGQVGMPAAAEFMQDLAKRDRATADKQSDIVTGQLPQMISGMAPFATYQDMFEAQFDPQELDDIYAQFDDPGNHGTLTAAAMSGLGALLDVYASPTVMLSMVPGRLQKLVPVATKLLAPGKAAKYATEIARKTYRYEDALGAVAASDRVVARAEAAVQKVAADTGEVPVEVYRKLLRAKEAQAKEQVWLAQFQDPGQYESIMLRAGRRNPEYVPEAMQRQYGLSAGGRYDEVQREIFDIGQEMAIRKQTLAEGAMLPVDWQDPAQMTLPMMQQRMLLGPSDAEYAGDALNMLVRGAEIDDVMMPASMAPEYHILPDVATSLSDHRKIAANNQLAAALKSAEALGPADQGKVGPARAMLDMQEESYRSALAAAKKTGDKGTIDEMRRQLRLTRKTRNKLKDVEGEAIDESWLPKQQASIMESPERYNKWLEVAGDRVMRSLYPGGLLLTGWESKLGQIGGMGREPMRYYMSYAPDAWERIRSTVLRNDTANKSSLNMVLREAEKSGIVKKRSKFNPARHYSPHYVDKKASAQLFDMLDTVKGTDEFNAIYDAASPEMKTTHDRIRIVLDHMADLQGVSETEKYLTGYIRHVFDSSLFKNGARPIEFIGLPVKAEVFASHLQHRAGMPGYSRDSVLALDLYFRAAYRKIMMEPLYDDIIQTGKELATKHGNRAHISYANDLINQLKGKPSFLSSKVDEWIGSAWNSGGGVKVPFRDKKLQYRPGSIDRAMLGIFSLVHSGLTTGPRYAILQLASGMTTTASRFGPFDTMRGVLAMTTKEGQQMAKAAGTYKPFYDFLESPELRKFTEFFQTKVKSPPLFISNQQAEDISRGITYNAAIKSYMRKAGYKTLREANEAGFLKRIMFESVRASEEANHLYGPLGRSPFVTRTMGTPLSVGSQQFLSFIPKQTEEIFAQLAREPGKFLEYMAFSGQLSRTLANQGIDMTDEVGLGYLPHSPTDITSPAVDAALTNLQLMDAMNNNDAEGVERFTKNLARSLTSLVPGSQIVISGGKAVQRLTEGAVRTASGDKLYDMSFGKKPDEGLGGELLPTLLMQKNIHETLVRRGIKATQNERSRFYYNLRSAVDNYVDALESGDTEAATKLADELGNVYMVRFSSITPIQKAIEARSVSQTLRNLEGNPQLIDVYMKIYQQHGIAIFVGEIEVNP